MNARNEPVTMHRESFSTQWLMDNHPPVWRHRNKQLVFDLACPKGTKFDGTIGYSRWKSVSIEDAQAACHWDVIEPRPDVYDYEPHQELTDAVEWHVNFADPILFVAYDGGLFAQDEMQVAEHPALGALVEALSCAGAHPQTVESEQPTPVLIRGVGRHCRIATEPNASEGRPQGLYGNRFAMASEDAIRRATTRLDPPTQSHLIAMAAPCGGVGTYLREEIQYVLLTAYTGYRAAVLESGDRPTVIHSGFWGCGAFGGNRQLMTLLQVIASNMAGVDRLVFHTFDQCGMKDVSAAKHRSRQFVGGSATGLVGEQMIDQLTAHGFQWGVSDGN